MCQRNRILPIVLLALTGGAIPNVAAAEVSRLVIASCVDVLDGAPFGDVGPYEKCVGRIYFSLDPTAARNRIIADIDKAPRDADGKVQFSSDLWVLRPKDTSRGNGVLFFDVVNRGGKGLLSRFNLATGATDPTTEGDFGDGFLMKEGYTLVAVGWEPRPNNPAVALYPPVATDNGQPITGEISNWFIPLEAGRVFDLDSQYWTGFRNYPPLDPNDPAYRLTERLGPHGEQTLLPRESWEFGQMVEGRVVYDQRYLFLWTGFRPGYTYELTYETKDPQVIGVGFAAVRDAASYFKYSPESVVRGQFAYAYGSSQTGRALRQLIYEGFTIDERDRKALDGIFVSAAGTSFGTFNVRFGQPNEGGGHTETRFPMLYQATGDPTSGRTEGLGSRIPPGLEPKILLVETSSEYWDRGRVTALNHTSLNGQEDVTPAENVRFYLLASYPHSGGGFPPDPRFEQQLPGNPIDVRPASRALLRGLDLWVREGVEPPASAHPTLAARTLVRQSDIRFPNIPGVQWPYSVPGAYRSDLPGPLMSHPLPFLVPAVDTDGNETDGLVLPDVAVPLATYLGWAFRSVRAGAPGEILMMAGSYAPFPRTRAERERSGDPRLSIAERYASREEYLRRFTEATQQLVAKGYLLELDVNRMIERAGDHWDLLMGPVQELTDHVRN